MAKETVNAPDFDGNQRARFEISMSCDEWDRVGQALAGTKDDKACQSTADAILHGLYKVGYFIVRDAA